MQEILKRWGVELRKGNSVVEHAMYKTRTEVNPKQFAVYQAAICACYASWFNLPQGSSWMGANLDQHKRWYAMLAQKDGFELPDTTNTDPKQAQKDYHDCVAWLVEQGLYDALLD